VDGGARGLDGGAWGYLRVLGGWLGLHSDEKEYLSRSLASSNK